MSDKPEMVLDSLPIFPKERAGQWPGLRVEGLVSRPTTLSLADLQAMPQGETVRDFTCEEGWVVREQRWEGVPLSHILEHAGVEPDARFVSLSADIFSVVLSMSRALDPTTLAVLRLNGEPLPEQHGAPCRLLVAGKSCAHSVKWLDRIEVTAQHPSETGPEIARERLASRP